MYFHPKFGSLLESKCRCLYPEDIFSKFLSLSFEIPAGFLNPKGFHRLIAVDKVKFEISCFPVVNIKIKITIFGQSCCFPWLPASFSRRMDPRQQPRT